MTWLIVIIIVAIIGAIIGFIVSDDGEKGSGAFGGFITGAVGCGAIIIRIAIAFLSLYLLFRLGNWLFS